MFLFVSQNFRSFLQIRVREDQEAIIASLSPEDHEALLDLRPFMQARPPAFLMLVVAGPAWFVLPAMLGLLALDAGMSSCLPGFWSCRRFPCRCTASHALLGSLGVVEPACTSLHWIAAVIHTHPASMPPAALAVRGERGCVVEPRLPVGACCAALRCAAACCIPQSAGS